MEITIEFAVGFGSTGRRFGVSFGAEPAEDTGRRSVPRRRSRAEARCRPMTVLGLTMTRTSVQRSSRPAAGRLRFSTATLLSASEDFEAVSVRLRKKDAGEDGEDELRHEGPPVTWRNVLSRTWGGALQSVDSRVKAVCLRTPFLEPRVRVWVRRYSCKRLATIVV
jgi:hypothetical protein